MKKVFVVWLLLAVCYALVTQTLAATIPTVPSLSVIKARGVLRVAIFADMPPFGYIDESGQHQGYDIYLARRFAQEMFGDESKIEFKVVSAAERVQVLQEGSVDIVLASFTVLPEREKLVDFANPYFKTALGLVSSNAQNITNLKQLKGKKLILTKDTTADRYFLRNFPEVKVVLYERFGEAFDALLEGKGDAIARDNMPLLAWTLTHPDYKLTIPKFGNVYPIAPAVRKGNRELRNWINAVLVKLGDEQFAHKAYEATLRPFYGDAVDPDALIVEGGML
ncbi:glutamine ABC transporter substrate-binding protein [Campylobacterota bacterium]|nr:glutamine ABC transporter substrate-binding protein [Campylobacterota bacterium]